MNPQQYLQPTQIAQPINPHDVIMTLRRHPIGIIGVYIIATVLMIVLAIGGFGWIPSNVESMSSSQVYSIIGVSYFVFSILASGFVFIAHIVYWSNKWQMSDDSLTQVIRTGLFDQQTSHLSLGNIQDVTSAQDGILPHLFNYGILRVETAGETSRFQFIFCPRPAYYSKMILDAREKFMQLHVSKINNNGVNTTYAPVQQTAPPAAYASTQSAPVQQTQPFVDNSQTPFTQ